MARKSAVTNVKMGFEGEGVRLAISDIRPLRPVTDKVKNSVKYAQIVASIREVGIIEPPIVTRNGVEPGKYLLLDGHLRLEILRDLDQTEVTCLISTDDEAFTYNKRVNRLAIIQEYRMIMKAIERGVPPERIAKSLNVNLASIRHKRRMLVGISPEVEEILKDKHLGINTFDVLRKMKPLRQIAVAENMVAMNRYTMNYAKSLLAGTPQSELVEPHKPKVVKGLSPDQIAMMEKESSNLDREFKIAEQSFGSDHLDLVLAKGYLAKILSNARVVRYLAQNQKEILGEFQKIAELEPADA